jgi:two-component system chemotaxis response regulator CheB
LKVSVAQDGEPLLSKHIYLAPGTTNCRILIEGSSPIVRYVDDSYKEFNHPSIDCLFESIATVYGGRAVAAILTGMGKDGVMGLEKIRAAGGLTLTQDEFSSVVYGMPKAAFESGAAKYQMPLAEIPNFIISAL